MISPRWGLNSDEYICFYKYNTLQEFFIALERRNIYRKSIVTNTKAPAERNMSINENSI